MRAYFRLGRRIAVSMPWWAAFLAYTLYLCVLLGVAAVWLVWQLGALAGRALIAYGERHHRA